MHIEDERRLTYVAITRAERELNIVYNREPSQFIANSDWSLLKHLDTEGNEIKFDDA